MEPNLGYCLRFLPLPCLLPRRDMKHHEGFELGWPSLRMEGSAGHEAPGASRFFFVGLKVSGSYFGCASSIAAAVRLLTLVASRHLRTSNRSNKQEAKDHEPNNNKPMSQNTSFSKHKHVLMRHEAQGPEAHGLTRWRSIRPEAQDLTRWRSGWTQGKSWLNTQNHMIVGS